MYIMVYVSRNVCSDCLGGFALGGVWRVGVVLVWGAAVVFVSKATRDVLMRIR